MVRLLALAIAAGVANAQPHCEQCPGFPSFPNNDNCYQDYSCKNTGTQAQCEQNGGIWCNKAEHEASATNHSAHFRNDVTVDGKYCSWKDPECVPYGRVPSCLWDVLCKELDGGSTQTCEEAFNPGWFGCEGSCGLNFVDILGVEGIWVNWFHYDNTGQTSPYHHAVTKETGYSETSSTTDTRGFNAEIGSEIKGLTAKFGYQHTVETFSSSTFDVHKTVSDSVDVQPDSYVDIKQRQLVISLQWNQNGNDETMCSGKLYLATDCYCANPDHLDTECPVNPDSMIMLKTEELSV